MKTQFERDLKKTINFNGKPMSISLYNLVVSIRDVKLYSKGIVPHRNWKITYVKEYFGLKGRDHQKLIDQLVKLKDEYFPQLKNQA